MPWDTTAPSFTTTDEPLLHGVTYASFQAPYSSASCASVTLADLALFQVTGAVVAALAPAAELPTNAVPPPFPLPNQL
jgi:hypothetical protein